MKTIISVLTRCTGYLPLRAWKLHRSITRNLSHHSPFLLAYKTFLLFVLLFMMLKSFLILAQNQRYGLFFSTSRHISRLFGLIMGLPIPTVLRPVLLGLFAKLYHIDLSELRMELNQFKTMKQFFIRELKDGARPLCHSDLKEALTSPCDGIILKADELKKGGLLETVKGRPYSMRQFLFGNSVDDRKAELFMQQVKPLLEKSKDAKTKLMYTVIYLSPQNYHRFHAPAQLTISSRRHIEGYLQTVKPEYMKKHPYVLKSNERVNLFGEWDQGLFIFSAVGALNVGSIHLLFEPWLSTNALKPHSPYFKEFSYVDTSNQICLVKTQTKLFHFNQEYKDENSFLLSEKGVEVDRGQPLGYFNFGSTIVMLFETKRNWEFSVEEGKPVKMGQVLGHSP